MVPLHEIEGLMGQGIHTFRVWGCSWTARTFGTTLRIPCRAIGMIVTLLVRADLVIPMIPLAKMGALVTRVGDFEHAGDVELLPIPVSPLASIPMIFMPRGHQSGLNGSTGGAAGCCWCIPLGEAHSFGRESLHLRSAIKITSRLWMIFQHLQGSADPALVIGEDEDEIRSVVRSWSRFQARETAKCKKDPCHTFPQGTISDELCR